MELTLPLRTPTVVRLDAGCRTGKGCRQTRGGTALEIRAGNASVHGRLETRSGEPLSGAEVAADERIRTRSAQRRVALLRTDGAGRFFLRLRGGPSRTVRFRYGGEALLKPASGEVQLLSPARSTITASRRLVRNGHAVAFAGRLRGGPVPEGGKLIDLQVFYRGRWHTFATPRTDGRKWAYRYRFQATSGRVTYRFRARIRREAAYPYELGHTRVVRVTVTG
jgi:hypothetical protein